MGPPKLNILLAAVLLFTPGSARIARVKTTKGTIQTTRPTLSTMYSPTVSYTFTDTTSQTTAPTTITTTEPPGECDCKPCKEDEVVRIDLETNGLDITSGVTGSMPGLNVISYVDPSSSSYTPCDAQVLLSVDFLTYPPCDYKNRYCFCMKGTRCSRRMLEVSFKLSGTRNGWMFNFGDSVSNNGWGGDSHHQKNDAEMQCLHPDVAIYENDKCGSAKVGTFAQACNATRIVVRISDEQIWYKSNNGPTKFQLCEDCLFALNNQDDSGPIGSPNERIYISLNRVVRLLPSNRVGNGLCRAKFSWVCPPCDHE